MPRRSDRTPSELRRFGLVTSLPLALLAALLAWQGRPAWPVLAALAAALALAGVCAPRLLRPVEHAWMRLARLLALVSTTVLLILAFLLLITPLGLLLRLLGKRPIALRFDPSATTYWRPVERDGPATRPETPY